MLEFLKQQCKCAELVRLVVSLLWKKHLAEILEWISLRDNRDGTVTDVWNRTELVVSAH